MFANQHMFEEQMIEEMETRNQPHKSRSKALLADRSVNIYSDMADIVREGDIITLTGELVGFENADVALQWQYDDGLYWIDVPGANSCTHAFAATAETINYSWRLSVMIND